MNWHFTHARIPSEALAPAWLQDSYAWHQALWEIFPGSETAARSHLSRCDLSTDHVDLFLISAAVPQRPDWCAEAQWKSRPVAPDFPQPRRYQFCLTANPTKKIRTGTRGEVTKNGRRIALETSEELQDWLQRKGRAGGFKVLGTPELYGLGPRQGQRRQRRLVHAAVDFQGLLEVTDVELFRRSWRQGLGSAKAFGYGLLLLFPAT
jgi:CRISPR system Cascade subunit CasE